MKADDKLDEVVDVDADAADVAKDAAEVDIEIEAGDKVDTIFGGKQDLEMTGSIYNRGYAPYAPSRPYRADRYQPVYQGYQAW